MFTYNLQRIQNVILFRCSATPLKYTGKDKIFTASNGIAIYSKNYVQLTSPIDQTLYIHGRNDNADPSVLSNYVSHPYVSEEVAEKYYEQMKQALDEFAEFVNGEDVDEALLCIKAFCGGNHCNTCRLGYSDPDHGTYNCGLKICLPCEYDKLVNKQTEAEGNEE